MERHLIGDDCEIQVGPGLSKPVVLPPSDGRRRVMVITQPGEAGAIASRVVSSIEDGGVETGLLVLPDGEAAKSLSVIEDAYRRLAAFGLTRSDTVVAVGGGTVTDAGGFVAATYLRGIEAVYVPTTLLGAVDAAIGGKTGVNLDGKNMIGAFRHPTRVIIDTDILQDLPDELWREGAAEAVKAGLIADPHLFEVFESHGRDAPVLEIVQRSVAVKAAIVAEDFRESGRRAILNYGHTVGHAIELSSPHSHGPSVAIGMVAAAAASELAVGFSESDRQNAVLSAIGLPVHAEGIDATEVRRLLAMDKKRDAGGLRMVLLRTIGEPVVQHVDSPIIDHALGAVGLLGD